MEPAVAQLVDKLGSAVKLEDCFDVPEQIYQQEYFELTKEQKDAIAGLNDVVPIVVWTKTHQICGGSLKGDQYVPTKYFKSEKVERLLELIKEHPLMAVVCRYNAEIDYLYKKSKKVILGKKCGEYQVMLTIDTRLLNLSTKQAMEYLSSTELALRATAYRASQLWFSTHTTSPSKTTSKCAVASKEPVISKRTFTSLSSSKGLSTKKFTKKSLLKNKTSK
jgi:hypothetical protein